MIPKENTNLLHMRVFYNENTSLIPTTHHSYSAKKTCYIELEYILKLLAGAKRTALQVGWSQEAAAEAAVIQNWP